MGHTTFRNGKLFCTHCGGEHAIPKPLPVDEMSIKITAFDTLHKDCKKTWEEPIVNPEKPVYDRAMWWIANASTGLSSKTMWNCFMGNEKFPVNYPHDPDDFSRCYKLLQTVPEWKKELHKLKPLCAQWSRLVDHWDELTRMYEENKATNWEKKDEIGMFELMDKLTRRDAV